jgi:hypothetical protein
LKRSTNANDYFTGAFGLFGSRGLGRGCFYYFPEILSFSELFLNFSENYFEFILKFSDGF